MHKELDKSVSKRQLNSKTWAKNLNRNFIKRVYLNDQEAFVRLLTFISHQGNEN